MPRLVFYPKKRSLFTQKRFFTIENEKCPALHRTERVFALVAEWSLLRAARAAPRTSSPRTIP